MDRFVLWIDARLRRHAGLFEYSDDARCLFRIARARAQRRIETPELSIRPGDPLLELHLWNEHVPPLPPAGADMRWSASTHRRMVWSLHLLSQALEPGEIFEDVLALRGITLLFGAADEEMGRQLARRIGFVLLPYRPALGQFGVFWENFYTWWLMRTFNKPSVSDRSMFNLDRAEVWMSRATLLGRYGRSKVATVLRA